MLKDYMEAFTRLQPMRVMQDTGVCVLTWEDGDAFQAALTCDAQRETLAAALPASRERVLLLHGTDVLLRQEERIRREADGSIWRVRENTLAITPACAEEAFCQTHAERVVTA